jgi:hypothetical protein
MQLGLRGKIKEEKEKVSLRERKKESEREREREERVRKIAFPPYPMQSEYGAKLK